MTEHSRGTLAVVVVLVALSPAASGVGVANQHAPPEAVAGDDATVRVGEPVTLDGSASSDNGSIASYRWDVDGDGTYDASGRTINHTYDTPGTVSVTLLVTDDQGHNASDTVTVTVEGSQPPTADAGEDQRVLVGETVTFDGSGSTDDAGVVGYEWDVGPDGTVDLTGASPTHAFDSAGTYAVELRVTDGDGNTATDTVTVAVLERPRPTADAGEDRTVGPGDPVTLDGTGSHDDVGVANYFWDVGADGEFEHTGPRPTLEFGSFGRYTVELLVLDTAGNRDTDTVTITVADRTPPTAEAGPNQSVPAGEAVTFDASGTADDVAVDSYAWDVDGDGDHELSGPSPTYTFGTPGTHVVELLATDTSGNNATDTVTVTALDVTPPTITSFGLSSPSGGTVGVAVESNEALENVTVEIGGPERTTLARGDFSEAEDDGNYTYTASHSVGSGGNYTATLATAEDAAGNDGAADQSGTALVEDPEATDPDDDGGGDSAGSGSGDGDDGGGGGGAGGAGGASRPSVDVSAVSANEVRVEVRDVSRLDTVTARLPSMDGDAGDGTELTAIRVTSGSGADFELTAERAGEPPSGTPALDEQSGLAYFSLDHGLTDGDVANARLTFSVSKDRLEAWGADPASVTIYRFEDGAWAGYDTRQVGEDADAVHFSATFPGLSRFAVGADRTVTPTAEATTSAPPSTTAAAARAGEEPPGAGPVESEGGFGLGAVVVLALLVALFGVGYLGSGPLYRWYASR